MRKILSLVAALSLVIVPFAHAQNRGVLTNVYASWIQATTTLQTITFPYPSRSLIVNNGSTSSVCINLDGGDLNGFGKGGLLSCSTSVGDGARQIFLDGDAQVRLEDFVTDAVSIKTLSSTASPISIIATY